MNIIISQFSYIEPNSKKFNKYLSNEFKKRKIELVVIGDYTSSLFFKEYKSKAKLEKLFAEQKKYFSLLAKKYNTTMIIPIIEAKEKQVFKSIMITSPKNVKLYQAQKLMEMSHWNEKAFFDNTLKAKEPFVFKLDDMNISVLFGWESHFDELWIKLKKKQVDVVIIPTANTFNSNPRWMRLMQIRSFLNTCYIVRVNRVGSYIENNLEWKFYGNSFVALPDGNIGDMLNEKEGILVSQINKTMIDDLKQTWKFR